MASIAARGVASTAAIAAAYSIQEQGWVGAAGEQPYPNSSTTRYG